MTYKKKRSNTKAKAVYIDKNVMDKITDFISLEGSFGNYDSNETFQKKVISLIEDLEITEIANSKDPAKLESKFAELKSEILTADLTLGQSSVGEILKKANSSRNNADAGLSMAKLDIYNIWKQAFQIGNGESTGIATWISEPIYGEKFMPFKEKGERYIYTGYKNQMLITSALEDSMKEASSMIITKNDIQTLVNENFAYDPSSEKTEEQQIKSNFFSALKGKMSLCSIYVPKIYVSYTTASGEKWKDNEGKVRKPSEAEIQTHNLRKSESVTFMSSPVWSISQFKDYLSDDALESYKALSEKRNPTLGRMRANIDQDLASIINDKIKQHLEEQNIKYKETTSNSFYKPLSDSMFVVEGDRFSNPIFNYRTFMHELAHSSMHLIGRRVTFEGKDQNYHYAVEEIVAETVSYLSVKRLEKELKEEFGGSLPPEWEKNFADSYNKSGHYIDYYEGDSNFGEMIKENIKGFGIKDIGVINETIKNIVLTNQLIYNGNHLGKEITKEYRLDKAKGNLRHWKDKHVKEIGVTANPSALNR